MKKILSSMSRRLMFQKLVSHEPSLKKMKNFITMHRPTPRDGRRQKRVTALRLAELNDLFMAIPSKSMRPLLPLYDVFQDLASAAKNAGVDVSTSFGKSLSLLLPPSLSFHPSLSPPLLHSIYPNILFFFQRKTRKTQTTTTRISTTKISTRSMRRKTTRRRQKKKSICQFFSMSSRKQMPT